MVRYVLAVLIGVIIANAAFFAVESFGQLIYPAPPGLNFDDPNVLKDYVAGMQFGAFAVVAAGWAAGSFLAGFAEKTISRDDRLVLPMVIGGLLTLSAVWNFLMVPHPAWFVVVSLLIFVPFTVLGHKAVPRR